MQDKSTNMIQAKSHKPNKNEASDISKFPDGRYIGIVDDVSEDGCYCVVTYSTCQLTSSVHEGSQGKIYTGERIAFYINNGKAINATKLV